MQGEKKVIIGVVLFQLLSNSLWFKSLIRMIVHQKMKLFKLEQLQEQILRVKVNFNQK